MAEVSRQTLVDCNVSKEEGEITDDEEIEESTPKKRVFGSRDKERHIYGYDGRSSRSFDNSHSVSSSRQRDSLPGDRYRSREALGSRYRSSYAEATRSSLSPNPQETSYRSYHSYGTDRGWGRHRDHEQERNTSHHTSGSASSWRLRKFCPSSSEHSNTGSSCPRLGNSHVESSGSLQSDYEKLLLEFHNVKEQLDVLKAQDEFEKSAGHAKAPSPSWPKPASATSELTVNQQFDTAGSPILVTLSSSQSTHPVSLLEGKKEVTLAEEGLSDISSQETDFNDNASSDQIDSGKENGVSSLTHGVSCTETASLKTDGSADSCAVVTAAATEDGALRTVSVPETPRQAAEEEDDLDELELRRLALESAAARFKMTSDDTADHAEGSQLLSPAKNPPREPFADATVQSTNYMQQGKVEHSVAAPRSKPICSDSQSSGSHASRGSHTSSSSLPKSQAAKAAGSSSKQRRSSERRQISVQPRNGARKSSRETGDKKSGPKQKPPPKNRASSAGKSKTEREKSVPPRRPLPFAPVKLKTIRLTSVSPRGGGGLREAASKAQLRTRQPSVARQLPKPTGQNSTLATSANTGKDRQRLRDSPRTCKTGAEKEKEDEERKQEIAKILSLEDPKEQAERFLRLLSGALAKSASAAKSQQLKDNYEEVEMDIDSSDEVAEELRIDEFQSAMQPVHFMGVEPVGLGGVDAQLFHQDLLLGGGQWLSAPFLPPPVDPFTTFVGFPPSVSIQPPPPPVQPPLPPPLPADDVPQPPQPPPPPGAQDAAADQAGIDHMNSDLSKTSNDACFSSDIGDAVRYLRRKVSSENVDVRSEKPCYEIPVLGDVKSRNEQIPFIDDDAKPSDGGATSDISAYTSHASPSKSSVESEKLSQDVLAAYAVAVASRHSGTEDSCSRVSTPPFLGEENASPVSVGDDKQSPTSVMQAVMSQHVITSSANQVYEEEENEEELRAQLLRSLLSKRKEAEMKQQASSVDSSPSASVTASPKRLIVKKTRGVSRRVSIQKSISYSMAQFPIHKPVVVTLGHSSESEEEDPIPSVAFSAAPPGNLLGGFDIDGFLKAQRKTVQEQTSVSPEQGPGGHSEVGEQLRVQRLDQEKQLRHQEMELGKQRQDIVKGQGTLQQLLSKASKFLADMRKAEARATHLREQLQTTEKLIMRYRHLVQDSKSQAKEVSDTLLKKKEVYQASQASTLALGRRLHGNNYKPRMINLDVGVKRKVQLTDREVEVTRGVQPAATKKRKLAQTAQADLGSKENVPAALSSRPTAEARKREKERLQKLAEEYEEKIRQLRSLQGKGAQLTPAGNSVIPGVVRSGQQPPAKKEKARLPSLESIKLEPLEALPDLGGKPRRRSLLDITQSPKPNLSIKGKKLAEGSGCLAGDAGGGRARTGADRAQQGKISFKMPAGLQLNNLCKIQKEKIQKVLSARAATCPDSFSHLELTCEPLSGLKLNLPGNRATVKSNEDCRQHSLSYTSPLLHFRAYRFSPYYRTKENLTLSSASYSHKLNPNRILCRYELSGTCNDQHCSWQHGRDYSLSDKEVLMDLVAYCPQLAGVTGDDLPEVYAKKIENYADSLLSQHKGKMTVDQLCLLLTSKVSECAKHTRPHTMFYERRPWRLSACEPGSLSLSLTSQFQTPGDTIDGVKRGPLEMDSVLDTEDVRYFVLDAPSASEEASEGPDMEGAVLATPLDTDLWLRLAYSKLSNPARSSEESLNLALNVLSRGLEKNRTSDDLWVHYLTLYSRHPDSSADFEDLCQTAVHCAPCYDLWWLLLEASNGFQAKDTVCSRALDSISKDREDDGSSPAAAAAAAAAAVRSHQVLEMLLYKVRLCSQSGRFKTALNFVQSVLGLREGAGSDKRYMQLLVHADSCVLWICLVHLVEFQTLPAALYDPSNQNPGRIMSKENLTIPWHSKRELATPLDKLAEYLGHAVTLDLSQPLDLCTSSQYVQAVRNLAELLRLRKKYREACTILQQVLKWAPHLEDVWLLAADIYAGCQDISSAKQVLLDAVSSNPYSAKLHHHYALLEMSQDNSDEALEHMEQFVICHFDSSSEDMTKVDPNFLFSKLLGLEMPFRKHLPPVKDELKEMLLKKSVHLWLCYCLLLELQGETTEAVDVYELALSSTTQGAHLAVLWKSYVQFLHRRCQSHSPGTAQSCCQQLQEAMFRSLTTAPTLVPVPFPRQHQTHQQQWRDLSHVTALVEFYVTLVVPDARAAALQTFYDLMTDNVPLLLRCVEMALTDGQYRRARSLCTAAVYDGTANLQLWKLALSLAQMEGTPKEVERLYVRAVRSMPLSVSLWKDFLLFEVSQENLVAVQTILAQCQDLGLNIQGYVATISAPS